MTGWVVEWDSCGYAGTPRSSAIELRGAPGWSLSAVAVEGDCLPVGQPDRFRSQKSGAVSGAVTDSADDVSGLDDILVQTALRQAAGTGTPDGPFLDVAVIVLGVDKNLHMWIGPIEPCHGSLYGDRARTIDRPCVMCP